MDTNSSPLLNSILHLPYMLVTLDSNGLRYYTHINTRNQKKMWKPKSRLVNLKTKDTIMDKMEDISIYSITQLFYMPSPNEYA